MKDRDERRASRRLLLLVLVSGMSALVYEIVWIRALGMWFGTTAGAISTVVAAFMAGLALGSLWLGRVADRHPRPLALYARLELGVAGSALVVSLLVLRGGPILAALARLVALAGPAAGAVRGLVLLAVLLVPTTLLGGTMPVLARAEVRGGGAGATIGALYAANTAGAVIGALLPDGVLVPFFGLTAAALVGVVGNLVASFGARRLAAARDAATLDDAAAREASEVAADDAPASPAASTPTSREGSPRVARAAIALFAISGFVAMGYEILWSRVLEHLVEGLAFSFSVLLAVYLVALAIGARVAARVVDRVKSPLAWGAGLGAGSAALALLPIALLGPWKALVAPLSPASASLARPSALGWWALSLVHSLWLEGGACLLMGAAFPMLASAAIRAGSTGRSVGVLYAANTLAGVVGAFVTGFVLLPAFGVERTLMALSLASALGAALIVLVMRLGGRSLAVPAVAALGIGAVAALLPAGHFSRLFLKGTVEYLKEGTTTSAAVLRRTTFDEVSWRELATPGVSMSDTRFVSRRYMALMAHLPLFLAREQKSALLICFGVGNTARAVLAHPEIERFDIVDIAPEVLGASPYFAAATGSDPLRDPRVDVIVGDGRAHLLTSGRTYDVITSEPPPPNHAGVVNLYSREYYAAARRALRPGGVVVQWLPVFQLHEDESLAIVAAMAAELGWVSLYLGYGYQWIVVGAEGRPAIDVEAWARRARVPSVARDLAASGVLDAEELLGSELADDRTLRAALVRVAPITDDLPMLPYPMKEVRKPVLAPRGLLGEPLGTLLGLGVTPSPELAGAGMATHIVARALPLAYTSPPELRELAFGSALRGALALRPGNAAALALLDVGDEPVKAAERALVRDPRRVDAAFALARRAFYASEWQVALDRLGPIDPRAIGPAKYWLLRGGAERALGRFEDAGRSFARAADASKHEGFRAAVMALANDPAAPWPPEAGPLARPGR